MDSTRISPWPAGLYRRLAFIALVCGLCIITRSAHAQTAAPPSESGATLARSTFAPVPLRPATPNTRPSDDTSLSGASLRTSSSPLITICSSLAIVLGLFAALVWVTRKAGKGSHVNREISDDAMRILGKKSLGPQGSITLVRCGQRIFIVGIHSTGMQRLGEITDDEEVRHLEALCLGESSSSFHQTLEEIQREPIKRGFVGEEIERPTSKTKQRLFSTF